MNKHFTDHFLLTSEKYRTRKEICELFSSLSLLQFYRQDLRQVVLDHSPEVISLYEKLIILLTVDTYATRLILYFPFELIPDTNLIQSSTDDLRRVFLEFTKAYQTCFIKSLKQPDIRANFVDGDIPETWTNPLPRVIKAVHLIPILIEKGIYTVHEVLDIIACYDDGYIVQSFIDTLPLLIYRGYITSEVLQSSPVREIRESMYLFSSETTHIKPAARHNLAQSITHMRNQINMTLKRLEHEKFLITQKRFTWKVETLKMSLYREAAHKIYYLHEYGQTRLMDFISFGDTDDDIVMVRCLLLQICIDRPEYRKYIDTDHESLVLFVASCVQHANPEIQKLACTLHHKLVWLGYASREELSNKRISYTDLFTHSLRSEPMPIINQMLDSIISDEILIRYIIPTVVVYGSSVKQYSVTTTDYDCALFIKPGITNEDLLSIQSKIGSIMNQYNIEPLLFLLRETECGFDIIDNNIPGFGDSIMPHVFFHGLWHGDYEVITNFQKKLFYGYHNNHDRMYGEYTAKYLWQSELERDILQYRLLHRGYHQLYPAQSLFINVPEHIVRDIDGDTAFWDEGYRRLACKLFLEYVFL